MTPYWKGGQSESCACTVTFEQLTPEMTRRPVTEKDIEDHLMTAKVNSPPLDILIRTSGVKRLSDYLLWQVGPGGITLNQSVTSCTHPIRQCTENTQIHFIDTFWPDMGLLDLLPIILDYQRKIWSQ